MTLEQIEAKATPEMYRKARACKNTQEVYDLAKENGLDITFDQAREIFEYFNPSQSSY